MKKDGTIVAHGRSTSSTRGAYAVYKPRAVIGGANQAAGPYRMPNCTIDSTFVYTNNIPGGFMRAPGDPQGVFAIESHLDEIARQMGMDPLDFELKNLVIEGRPGGFGEEFEHFRASETLQAAADAAGYRHTKATRTSATASRIGDRGTGGGEGTTEIRCTRRPGHRRHAYLRPGLRHLHDARAGRGERGAEARPARVEIEMWNTDEL